VEVLTESEFAVAQRNRDSTLNTLWHTKLNPLAPVFVPVSRRNQQSTQQTAIQSYHTPQIDSEQIKEYQNVFEMLPYEVLYMIFNFLKNPLDLEHCQRVCWLWRNILLGRFLLKP
jgi:hypothetical protein